MANPETDSINHRINVKIMYNPIRRNRNIGTSKQGHGQNNKMRIPSPACSVKVFFEHLTEYLKETRVIAGNEFLFVTERTITGFEHACSVDDVATILEHIPKHDLLDLNTVIFRQPKRKETILSPVWGRLALCYEFEGHNRAAIILEAVDLTSTLKWTKHLTVADQQEFKRLIADGHRFVMEKNRYVTTLKREAVRNTQLYRTLLHEIGHYVQYIEIVERPKTEGESVEAWFQRSAKYDALSTDQKEQYAHRYAEKTLRELKEKKIVP